MDGTFKSVPMIYCQLFSIHVLPLVYCLLPDKRRNTYHNVLDIAKRRLADFDLVLDPDRVISDFERDR